MEFEYYISVILTAVSAILSAVLALPMLKIIQLSGYRARGVWAWSKGSNHDVLIRYCSLMLFGFISVLIFTACFATFEWVRYCPIALYIIFQIVFLCAVKGTSSNKLVFTSRMKRLFALTTLLILQFGAGIAFAMYYSVYCQTLCAAFAIMTPLLTLAANAITYPFEKLNNRKYVKAAKKKLEKVRPTVIGITGSYGKTTAKNILKVMLDGSYSVLETPASYNTPMGVCLTVNNSLTDEQVFIAELGARYKGDIAELCDIVSPKYGIITAIGDMHIQTLHSRAGVADAKFELAEHIPSEGVLFLNGYNDDCAALSSRECAARKIVTGSDVRYENLVIDGDGTGFDLVCGQERAHIQTKLLGAHIAELVALCAAVAIELGVPLNKIASAVASLPPVEHRLQLLSKSDAVTVIDDAYNSNPVGAKNALQVLSLFDGVKIIITPGFVELGTMEKQCNTELGGEIAKVCDYAFLVGSRGADIKKGAIAGGMTEDKIRLFPSRDEAVEALKEITQNKAVLFENDLPDNIK